MMMRFILAVFLAGGSAFAQDLSFTSFPTLTGTAIPTSALTGSQFTYLSPSSQITIQTSSSRIISSSATNNSNGTNTQATRTSSSPSVIIIGGGQTNTMNTTISGSSSTRTSTSATPTNTAACNGHPEFCTRKYSNITQVCAHNSAFAIKRNVASNQVYGIVDQLNDGIRMIQGETQIVNGTIYSCHTSCDLLNAGKFTDMLDTIAGWLDNNHNEVVTILIGNSGFADGVTVANYSGPISSSRIAKYLYEPAYVPQYLDQWPTLGEMILTNKRVVMFMDYNANQTIYPPVIDEFSNMWETPFSPTDPAFPCTQQRPPDLDDDAARNKYLYIANHNLNVAIDLSAILGNGGDSTLLVPDTYNINRTNGEYNQYGMLGAMSENCTAMWGRPPNFLLVDYYNYGTPGPGSVFEVAAKANGVTYTQSCCGSSQSDAVRMNDSNSGKALALAAAIAFAVVVLI